MHKRRILPYNPKLKELARKLRNNSTLSELGITILRFDDTEVLHDMKNVFRTIEIFIENTGQHTPNPSQEGSFKKDA